MGESPTIESLANTLKKTIHLATKAHSDRLISTTATAGASFSWGDIGGAQAAVESIITTECGAGESIDNTIDTLIAATYTNAEIMPNEIN